MPSPASPPPSAQPPVSPAAPPGPGGGANGQNGQNGHGPSASATVNRALRSAVPWGYRVKRRAHEWSRRLRGKPRGVSEGPNLLPLLIRVLACFSRLDGRILEEEIDSILGFLRHDYPEAVYSELRKQFRQALNEQPDLDSMAGKLNTQLSPDRKILLGIQLWDLICRAGQQQEHVVAFYKFMAGLGMTAQAIDIVYQLNSSENSDPAVFQKGASPLESLTFSSEDAADVLFRDLPADDKLFVYRYHDLVLIKNLCSTQVVANGRPLQRGALGRLYEGQRVVVGERVLTYQELVAYFNAKKNVAVPQVYLAINRDNEVSFERARTRESVLEVRFGLKVQVTALRRVAARLNGVELKAGTRVDATLEDKIVFQNNSELPLIDLRRRARALGGRFQLLANKSEYLVSNNPSLLDADDILLSPGAGGDVLLKISCDYEQKVGQLEVLQASRSILVNEVPVRNTARLADGDIIRVDMAQGLRCNFSERMLEEERNVIRVLEARDLRHSFRGGEKALDNISFTATRGEMICVMGSSGCGKSTLLRTLAGQNWPDSGGVVLNGRSLYDHIDELRGYIAYIPQDDAFDEQLTIEENLTLAAALRSPHLSGRERARRIDGKLIELGLNERRNSLVGSAVTKQLSGGERKRLNIGLDMIGLADIYLFDEPTSGLSSKDSEHVVEIIRSMSHNKIVLVTIHQPSSKIFQMFNKVVLLDKGGRLVFFGTPNEALNYFAQAENLQQHGVDMAGCANCGSTRPEFIFDVLETPLRDMSGDIIYEENSRGQLVPARRYSPEFWRDKYEGYRLIQDVRQVPLKKETSSRSTPSMVGPPPHPNRWFQQIRWRDEWTQLRTLLRRAFFSKLRNRVNVITTLVEAPLLAAMIAMVLRYNENGVYDFAGAYHIPIYLFLAVTVAMFLGLTNSADDIIRDRVVLQRERNLRIRLPYYILAKTSTLCMFALIQCMLFLAIGDYILQIRGMFWIYLGYMALTAFCGVALGLLISSLVADAKTAVNIVPLILIPQIIMGGALIKYEEMNRNLDFVYTIRRWIAHHPDGDGKFHEGEPRSKLQVPFVCQFMPMRWSYEGLVVAQAKLNPLTRRQERIQGEIQALADAEQDLQAQGQTLPQVQRDRLDGLKELLAMLSGLEARSARDVDRALHEIDALEARLPLDNLALRDPGTGVTAEQLYVNQKITDLASKAEMEQTDYRNEQRQQSELNVFFGAYRYIWHRKISVHVVDSTVLVVFSLLVLGLLHASLHKELER